jgi:hypothetical protein
MLQLRQAKIHKITNETKRRRVGHTLIVDSLKMVAVPEQKGCLAGKGLGRVLSAFLFRFLV